MIKKFAALILVLFVLAACSPASPIEATPDQGEITTQIAQTVQAELTRVAPAAPTTAVPESATEETQPTPTQEPLATATSDVPMATPTLLYTPTPLIACNLVEFISHITVIPDSSFTPGTDFTKTWRVKNIGACTWNTDYDLVFVNGDRMDSPASVALPREIKPGETIDLSINLEAPAKVGAYVGNWVLRNAAGDNFGTGKDTKGTLSTKISVSELDNIVLDFIEDACSAVWVNDIEETLPCPGVDGDPAGYALKVQTPTLENGIIENEPALVMHPRAAEDGNIRGRFPDFKVKAGDHFRAVIGCLDGQPDCQVRFQLRYRIPGEEPVTLQEWNEHFNGKVTKIDLDLTELAGKEVRFVLIVSARGSSEGDLAFWLGPRIVR
jgi:hypothetical protein